MEAARAEWKHAKQSRPRTYAYSSTQSSQNFELLFRTIIFGISVCLNVFTIIECRSWTMSLEFEFSAI